MNHFCIKDFILCNMQYSCKVFVWSISMFQEPSNTQIAIFKDNTSWLFGEGRKDCVFAEIVN